MVNAWGGADPTPFVESGVDYELGVRYIVNADISITAIRVYGTGGATAFPGRKAFIRTPGDVILAQVNLPDTLPLGWNTYNLTAAIEVNTASVWATYDVLTDYAVKANAFPQNSGDGLITADTGGFNATPGNLPNNLTSTFYGIDFVYTVINHFPPTVTATASTSGLTATVNLQVSDDHPNTCSSVIEWGDGATANVGNATGPFVHTYATPGLYAFLVTTTDADGNKDSYALPLYLFSSLGTSASATRDQIGTYLVGPYSATFRGFLPAVVGAPPVAGLWAARRSWDKEDNGRNFVRDAPAGTKSGAMAIIELSSGDERRVSVPIGTGRRRASYSLRLHVYVQSFEPYAEDAQDFAHALRDAIFTRLRADPTCASGGFELGGFQIGEGGDPWFRWAMSSPETNAEETRIYLLIEAEAHQYLIA